jgi:hypothetical protein
MVSYEVGRNGMMLNRPDRINKNLVIGSCEALGCHELNMSYSDYCMICLQTNGEWRTETSGVDERMRAKLTAVADGSEQE